MNEIKIGTFLNNHLFTDVAPFQIVRLTKSGKTAYVRAVKVERHPDWKPETIAGGFCGHTVNNYEQFWKYGELEGPEYAVRLTKSGWKSKLGGRHIPADKPKRFYDYNF